MHNSLRPAAQADEHVFLIGRPPVSDLIAYVRTLAVDSRNYDDGDLVREWRAANDRVLELEKTEAGIADAAAIAPLPPDMEALGAAARAHPSFRRWFNLIPTELGFVELDRMVVYQKHIDLALAQRIRDRLSPRPSAEELFALCVPMEPELPPVQVMQNAPNSFTFVSPSRDLRFLESLLLDIEQVNDPRKRPGTSMLGVVVGYGPNCVIAMHMEDRLVLSNGSHRAFALREHGITHVPCVIQNITRRDELELVGPDAMRTRPDLYLEAPRPPLLKDYFDPQLRKIVPVARKHRVVRVAFSVDTSDIPAY